MDGVTGYKIARPNGWDFYTGETINYRKSIGKLVKWPETRISHEVFIDKVNIASANPNDCFFTDCFVYPMENATCHYYRLVHGVFCYTTRLRDGIIDEIDCSAYRVEGVPVREDKRKWGFTELKVLEEIEDLDNLFGWKYSEVKNPINPLKHKAKLTQQDIDLLHSWATMKASIWDSISPSVSSLDTIQFPISHEDMTSASVWCLPAPFADIDISTSVSDSISQLVGTRVSDLICGSVGHSVGRLVVNSVWNSSSVSFLRLAAGLVEPSVGERIKSYFLESIIAVERAYIGGLFPNIQKWKRVKHKRGLYPFQCGADLWRRGLVPSFDGNIWRLHSGKKAEVVYEQQIP